MQRSFINPSSDRPPRVPGSHEDRGFIPPDRPDYGLPPGDGDSHIRTIPSQDDMRRIAAGLPASPPSTLPPAPPPTYSDGSHIGRIPSASLPPLPSFSLADAAARLGPAPTPRFRANTQATNSGPYAPIAEVVRSISSPQLAPTLITPANSATGGAVTSQPVNRPAISRGRWDALQYPSNKLDLNRTKEDLYRYYGTSISVAFQQRLAELNTLHKRNFRWDQYNPQPTNKTIILKDPMTYPGTLLITFVFSLGRPVPPGIPPAIIEDANRRLQEANPDFAIIKIELEHPF